MKGKGLGWVILLGALAVPAVLFFKWWTQMKAAQGVEARQTPPAGAPFGVPAASPQAAPIASEAALPRDDAPSPAPVPETPPAQAAPEPALPAEPAPAPVAAAPTLLAQAPVETPPIEEPSKPQAIEYMPKTSRDPMLSVSDLRELAKIKYQKEMSQRQVEEAAKPPEEPAAPPPRALCETLELQGIIGTGGDVAAIVNDKIVREGDSLGGGVVVERLTTRTIVFKKGRKTCNKRVSK
ncbi:MAG: hypothetical protein HYZ75_04855 [Elusimicrobia bacterium]|nr:hypothetical protein [Elusimicrobiota bacterium]